MSLRSRLLAGAGALLALVVVLLPTAALAHDKRTVGQFTFVVGFLNEPAIQGQPNGLDLTIADASGNPVGGADKTLKVAIAYGGGAPKELRLAARFGMPGKYTTDVIPTRTGTYSFVFSGTLNGTTIGETFESGPGRFDDVVSASTLEFPEAVPAPADLARQTQAANDTAQAAVQRATLFGLGGVAVGLIGVVLAVIALISRVRPSSTPSETDEAIAPTPGRG